MITGFLIKRKLVSNATFEVATGRSLEDDGPPVVYMVTLQPADLAAIQGLEVRYWPPEFDPLPNRRTTPDPTAKRSSFDCSAAWPADGPVETDFVAEWSGILYAPRYGPYSFRLVTRRRPA